MGMRQKVMFEKIKLEEVFLYLAFIYIFLSCWINSWL